MRVILWLTALACALYGGYWAVSSRAVLEGTNAALADLRSDGLADYGTVELSGFPSRFDLRIETPAFFSADGFARWQAPYVQIYALSYQPNHIIAVWPQTQKVTLGSETLEVNSTDARASVVFGIGASLPLDHAQMVAQGITVVSDADWGADLTEMRLAMRQGTSAANAQEVGIEVLNLGLTGGTAEQLIAAGPLPARVDRARLDAVLSLDGPIDRFTPKKGLRVLAMDVRALELDWGNARLRGDGALAINAAGQPEGRIALRVANWRDLLATAIGLGLVRSEFAVTVESALGQLAQSSGDPEMLELPLVFAGGRMSLGPLPLGPAPNF
jgi:hypothetical protein